MGKGFTGDYLKTIGADFASKKVKVEDNDITFQIWDLAGQDSYSAVRSTFYKGATAALLVFDIQDQQTMTNLRTWLEESIEGSNSGILVYFVIANKIDLPPENRRVSQKMAIEFCQRLMTETGINFYYSETSALTGQNIQETFDFLAYTLLEANNVKVTKKKELAPGIIDIKESMMESVSGEVEVSADEFNKLVKRVEKIEEKIETIQTKIHPLLSFSHSLRG
ncbi:MAG: ADP-ribosylation factor-like protein [Candidatus Heimdallarchaeaceae archaeon]